MMMIVAVGITAGGTWLVSSSITDNSAMIRTTAIIVEKNAIAIDKLSVKIEATAIAIEKNAAMIEANAAAIAELRDIVWSHSHAPVVTSDNN